MTLGEEQSSAKVHGLDPWGLSQVEKLLRGLSGVKSLKLVPNGHGGIEEVHVVGMSDTGAKQVVRNIESALLAEFGLQIDHRKISVARVAAPDIHPEPRPEREAEPVAEAQEASEEDELTDMEPVAETGVRRLLLESCEIDRRAGQQVACRVTLRDGDTFYEGEAKGPDSSRSRLEVAAQAVLEALNEATLEPINLRLDGLTRLDAFDHHLVVAVVQGQEHRRSVTLPGVSLIENSPEEAAVLACLQATNRWAGAA